jgi:predicted S18 family serine protease
MEGTIKVSYTVMCKNDVNHEVSLDALLKSEKVIKAIKSEFATGLRNLALSYKEDTSIYIKTQKEVFEFTANKNDFADLLELAEEDARKNKRFKKECDGVELVDIITID